jgi:hypothetical protein
MTASSRIVHSRTKVPGVGTRNKTNVNGFDPLCESIPDAPSPRTVEIRETAYFDELEPQRRDAFEHSV